MQRICLALFVAATILWPAGCSENYAPTPKPQPQPQAEKPSASEPSPSAATRPATPSAEPRPMEPSEPFVPADVPESKPAEPPPAETPSTEPRQPPTEPFPSQPPQSTPPAQHSILLSVGTALPQTGPEGTMMMFSVDYEYLGEPDPKAEYVWVIERTKGAPVKKSVRLEKTGTLPAAVFYWRPEEGPFRSHIEDRKGKRLSESIDMKL